MPYLTIYRNHHILLCTMRAKVQYKDRAIAMRKQGKSYKEIMAKVPVSKGTLSKWFAHVPLTKKEARFVRERAAVLQDKGRIKTAQKNQARNERRRDRVRVNAKVDFKRYKDDPFFILGLSLYWAKGAQTGNYLSFSSADSAMLILVMHWVSQYLKVEPADYSFRLYAHNAYTHDNLERYWSRTCAIPRSQFQDAVYTKNTKMMSKDKAYTGSLRMVVSGIDNLITLKTWQNELSEYYVEAI